MKVIGFNFTKILAEKAELITAPSISTNIEFKEITEEKIDFLKEDKVLKMVFEYKIEYQQEKAKQRSAGMEFFGNIILSVTKEENAEVMKTWKKKELSANFKVKLFNIILQKCAAKSIAFAEDLNLPSPIPLPKLRQKTAE